MNFLSRTARAITPYTAGEQPRDKKYVKLNTNENPYPPSPLVKGALEGFSADVLKLYPSPDATSLTEAIAAKEGVGRENVFCGNGSDEVLFLSFAAFFDDERPACFPDLTYSFYEVYARFFSVPTAIVPLKEDFTMDLDGMKGASCAGYFVTNPNAPTGVAIPLERMEDFVASVPNRLVIADEAYMDFYGQSCASLTKKYPNLLVVKTFSKSYSLAGIRCGYAVGNASLIEGLRRVKDCMNSYPVDAVCERVCMAALSDEEYHERTVSLVVSERERVRGELLRMGFTVPESGANFLFVGRGKCTGKQLYTGLKEAGVLVRFWDKPILSAFCRITVGTREENDILLNTIKNLIS